MYSLARALTFCFSEALNLDLKCVGYLFLFKIKFSEALLYNKTILHNYKVESC